MKVFSVAFLIGISFLQFCTNKQAKKKEPEELSESYRKDYYTLYKDKCAMCHNLNRDIELAPAMNKFSVSNILKYYDGYVKQDSIWKQHKELEITRKDLEGIANQVQSGDPAPNQ